MGCGIGLDLILIALGVGYIVCYLAHREEKDMKFLGVVIGSVIVILASIILINKLYMRMSKVMGTHCSLDLSQAYSLSGKMHKINLKKK